MNFDNDEEALGLFNRLLEQFHQAGINKIDNLVFVAPGAQYVNHIDTQIFGERKAQADRPCKGWGDDMKKDEVFKEDTPLSALFRKNSHEKLQQVMETWRPFLNGETEDVMKLNEFRFDLSRIQPSTVYLDLAQLINQGGLQCSMSVLAAYMFSHSNLSQSETTLYSQLRKYKCICE